AGRAGLDAAALGRGEARARPGAVHDGGRPAAGRPARRRVRGRADDAAAVERRAESFVLTGHVWGPAPGHAATGQRSGHSRTQSVTLRANLSQWDADRLGST